jgi:hypothetical protein
MEINDVEATVVGVKQGPTEVYVPKPGERASVACPGGKNETSWNGRIGA